MRPNHKEIEDDEESDNHENADHATTGSTACGGIKENEIAYHNRCVYSLSFSDYSFFVEHLDYIVKDAVASFRFGVAVVIPSLSLFVEGSRYQNRRVVNPPH